jgi:septal ring factor EnvC (AmiA/AmiB activator)
MKQPLEKAMTESQKLSVLRDKLIRRRRALVAGFHVAPTDQQPNGEELMRIQNEIEAVERAMAEEKRAEFRL